MPLVESLLVALPINCPYAPLLVTVTAPLFIVGNDGGTNIGASLMRAASALGIPAELADARAAYDAPRAVARFN